VLSVRRQEGFRGLWSLFKILHAERWDIIYDAHGSLRSLFLRTLLSAPVKLTVFKRTWQRLFLIVFKRNLLKFIYFKDQLTAPLACYLRRPIKSEPTEIFLSDKEKARVSHLWQLSNERPTVGLVPSAQWEGKRWPLESFRVLVRELVSQNFNVAIFGGPKDQFAESLVPPEAHLQQVQNLQGQLTLLESCEGLRRCDLVVANDTGLMHAAEAVGTDVIAILGPTGEQFGFVPFRKRSRVVTHALWCRPCSKNGQGFCIRAGRRSCLKDLPVSAVFTAVTQYFQETPPRRHRTPSPPTLESRAEMS
jgi:heptosyltransferase-2